MGFSDESQSAVNKNRSTIIRLMNAPELSGLTWVLMDCFEIWREGLLNSKEANEER